MRRTQNNPWEKDYTLKGIELIVDPENQVALHQDDIEFSKELAKQIGEPSVPNLRGTALRRFLAKLALESTLPQPSPLVQRLKEEKGRSDKADQYTQARTAISDGEKALVLDVKSAHNVPVYVIVRIALQEYRSDLIAEGRITP